MEFQKFKKRKIKISRDIDINRQHIRDGQTKTAGNIDIDKFRLISSVRLERLHRKIAFS
jgi:uncharacterized protein YeeX (DUF496 family)